MGCDGLDRAAPWGRTVVAISRWGKDNADRRLRIGLLIAHSQLFFFETKEQVGGLARLRAFAIVLLPNATRVGHASSYARPNLTRIRDEEPPLLR